MASETGVNPELISDSPSIDMNNMLILLDKNVAGMSSTKNGLGSWDTIKIFFCSYNETVSYFTV